MFTIFVIIGIILLVGGLYCAYVYAEAKLEVQAQPREPMYECAKHGVFRAKHLIEFLKDENEQPYKWCPLCFNEKIHQPLDSTVRI